MLINVTLFLYNPGMNEKLPLIDTIMNMGVGNLSPSTLTLLFFDTLQKFWTQLFIIY